MAAAIIIVRVSWAAAAWVAAAHASVYFDAPGFVAK